MKPFSIGAHPFQKTLALTSVASAILLSTFPGWAAADDALETYAISTEVMGTELIIEVYGEQREALKPAVDDALAELKRIEDMMTTWRESPLTRLNEAAGKGMQPVPLELAQIIARGKALHARSRGAFDMTYYAVGRLWNFKEPEIPSKARVSQALSFVDASRIGIREIPPGISIPKGMAIGLGGIAKGYGVDRAMSILMKHGIRHAVVNAGGDMKVLGQKNGRPWEVAVKHPRHRDRAMAALRLSNQCMVTSGDYERFFEKEGVRYHHIIDPRTGYPATGCMSATVTGASAELADALATACCVLGPKKGLELLKQFPRTAGILVGLDGVVHASPSLSTSLTD